MYKYVFLREDISMVIMCDASDIIEYEEEDDKRQR